MLKQQAFTLVELLLVLVCIAIITLWSTHRYQLYQRRTQVLQIQTDLLAWRHAANTYFHAHGCDRDGSFFQLGVVNCEQLQQVYPLKCNRPPLVVSYLAKIKDTGRKTADNHGEKPIYAIEIRAAMSSKVKPDEIVWYQKQLHADMSKPIDNTLIWSSLPSNSYVEFSNSSWVLDGAGKVFRSGENYKLINNLTGATAGSFCFD